MEARGIQTNKGNLNRWIKATNELLRKIKKKIAELVEFLAEDNVSKNKSTPIAAPLSQYYTNRNAGAYSSKAKGNNLRQFSVEVAFLEERKIYTVEQLEDYVSNLSQELRSRKDSLKTKEKRMKELKTLNQLAADYVRLKPIADNIPPKGGWGKKHEKYMEEHGGEIRQFYAVKRKLDNYQLPDKKLTPKAWQEEYDNLAREYAEESASLKPMYAEVKQLRDIQCKVNTAMHDQEKIEKLRKDKNIAYE